MESHSPMQVAWLRYFSAWIVSVMAILLLQRRESKLLSHPKELFRPKLLPWVLVMGICTFLLSPIFQYTGLSQSSSTANTLIVAMEPLFAALLAWVIVGEPWKKIQGIAFLFAVSGFLLLSNIQPGNLDSFSNFQLGNLFFLATMPMEAMYSVVSRKIGGRVGALTLYLGASTLGFVVFSVVVFGTEAGFPSFTQLQWKDLGAILWMGPLGTAITYIYWTLALEKASVAAVSLTLFVQPILGAFVGAMFLAETLSSTQFIGALLILFALSLETFFEIKKGKSHVENNR